MTVSPTSSTLESAQTLQLNKTINPSTATEGVQWASSNTSVATVSNSGLVTAKNGGTATITLKNSSGTKSASCSITVIKKYKSSEINKIFYGELVTNYHGPNDGGIKYRIFYADGTNVYLISDDYVHKNYVPMMDGYTHKYHDYTVEFVRYPTESAWLSEYAEYFKRRTLWNPYYKADFADYAEGAPRLDMWLASYNQTHGTNISYKDDYNNMGYGGEYVTQVKYNNGSPYYKLPLVEDFNGIYMKTSRNKADGMMISKTTGINRYGIVVVGPRGDGLGMDMNIGNSEEGIRPIICLNSNVLFRRNIDGSYSISF